MYFVNDQENEHSFPPMRTFIMAINPLPKQNRNKALVRCSKEQLAL